jgi:hypothetical protein
MVLGTFSMEYEGDSGTWSTGLASSSKGFSKEKTNKNLREITDDKAQRSIRIIPCEAVNSAYLNSFSAALPGKKKGSIWGKEKRRYT